ncbi:RNA recognition motif domain-containing protein [Cupriavidus lacunae]|uniref:RNA-binding protein n=1 Tax=Cupriavidus lacunae TaxID=2666307 RepID=A0A370NPW4_9BURK|nr:RNA-binding protein [Cupriavidus lacunae]RDK07662.1 RNA-binding protein [Cupriavidus lacunae]
MALLMLSNLHPDTTEEQVKEFLERYGFPAFDEIEFQEGDGTRPSVTLTFQTVDEATLRQYVPRVHGVFWNGHKINALVLRERFS